MTSSPDPARGLFPWKLGALVALSAVGLTLPLWNGSEDEPSLDTWGFSGAIMGTTYNVRLGRLLPESIDPERLADTIRAILDSVDTSMSTYAPDSELNALSRHAGTNWVPVSSGLAAVIEVALDVGARSGGALDVTVGDLVEAWGFGPGELDLPFPTPREGSMVRPAGLELDRATSRARKTDPDISLDLSAVAKGFGVDEVARGLERHGVLDYLVEVGGEIRVAGQRADGTPWRVGVEAPEPGGRELYRTLRLTGVAVATSGDYRNIRTVGGKRISHFIDPRTGEPVPYRGTSVTVLHREAASADAWATAMSVLGRDAGIQVAESEGIAVLFVERTGDGYRSTESTAFTAKAGDSAPDRSRP